MGIYFIVVVFVVFSRRGRNEWFVVCFIIVVNWWWRRVVVFLIRYVRWRRWKVISFFVRNIGRRVIVFMVRYIWWWYMVVVFVFVGNRRWGLVIVCGVEVDILWGEWMGVFGVVGLVRLEWRVVVSIDFIEWSFLVVVLNRVVRIVFRVLSFVIIIIKIVVVVVIVIKFRFVLVIIFVVMFVFVEVRYRRWWRDWNVVWFGVRVVVMIW